MISSDKFVARNIPTVDFCTLKRISPKLGNIHQSNEKTSLRRAFGLPTTVPNSHFRQDHQGLPAHKYL